MYLHGECFSHDCARFFWDTQFIFWFCILLKFRSPNVLFNVDVFRPTLLTVVLLYVLPLLASKYIFLQEKGKVLALNNRYAFTSAYIETLLIKTHAMYGNLYWILKEWVSGVFDMSAFRFYTKLYFFQNWVLGYTFLDDIDWKSSHQQQQH